MAKRRKKSRRSTRSSRNKERTSSVASNVLYDNENYVAQIGILKKKIKDYQYVIDNFKDLILQTTSKVHNIESDGKGLITYLQNCIQSKDKDIDGLKQNLSTLLRRMNEKHKEHNKIVVSLRLEIEAIEEKLNSEKAVLTGKVESLENFSVERAQLQYKTTEIQNLIEETLKLNKSIYHEKDLELTVSQDQLFKEMLSRVSHLASEFRIGTEKRINKTERRTLEYNYKLNDKLANLSNRISHIMGKNKSYKQATRQLKHDINVLQEVRDEMHKNWLNHLKSLKDSISNCLEKEQRLSSMMKSFTTDKLIDSMNNNLFDEQIKYISTKEAQLNDDLQTLRSKYEHTLCQCEEYMDLKNKELYRLKQLIKARKSLCQLVYDCKTALQEAYEMLEPENAMKLNLSERIQRHDHLLTAFFILIYTCDQLISRITPYQIGDFRLNQITRSIPSSSIKQSSCGNKVMFSNSLHTFSSSSLAKSDNQTRKFSSNNNESSGSLLDSCGNDRDSTSDFPLALKFGLKPIDDAKQNISTNLIKELSKCSRQSVRRTNTPVLHSIAVQTDSLFASHKQPSNLCKKRSLNKTYFVRSSRGILQLPLINSTILAPKEDYDELYRFNIQSTYKHKSPILPSLYKLAKM
uniref:Cilia- and flagella-associated protein 157 n=2 Tax=Schistosoma mansoni TaxID=6183 RepID=A0A5K4EMI4_SCHMA